MRSIWTGSIVFSMVSIPAKLYTAVDDGKVPLHQYHSVCGNRITMPKYCPVCEKMLESSEIKKGYEISSDQHVILDETDFQSLPLKSLKQIEVVEFTRAENIDVRAYTKPYFVACEDAGLKPFILFVNAMEAAGLVGIAKLTYREREHLAAIRPFEKIMLLHTLHYADELRSCKELQPQQMAMISNREQEMATALVKAMAGDFKHANYKNEYRYALETVIEAKLEGKPMPELEAVSQETKDIAEALIASLKLKGAEVPVPA